MELFLTSDRLLNHADLISRQMCDLFFQRMIKHPVNPVCLALLK